MNNIEIIRSKIYEIRGQKVMLDRDLAEMYGAHAICLLPLHSRELQRSQAY